MGDDDAREMEDKGSIKPLEKWGGMRTDTDHAVTFSRVLIDKTDTQATLHP